MRRAVHTFSPASGEANKYQIYTWGWRNMNNVKRGSMSESKLMRKVSDAYQSAALSVSSSGVSMTPKILGVPLDALPPRKVSCGDTHMAFITEDHKLYTLGSGVRGKLGVGSEENHPNDPQLVHIDEPVVDVSCGSWHTLAVTESGKVYGWGYGGPLHSNYYKKFMSYFTSGAYGLGLKARGIVKLPRQLSGELRGVKVRQVSCGMHHSLALSDENQLYVWGNGSHGRLGNGNVDSQLPSLSPVSNEFAHVSAGKEHSLAIDNQGSMWGWGKNDFGQIADNSAMEMYSMTEFPVMLKVEGIRENETFVQVSAGERHGLGLSSEGRVFMWGDKITAQPTCMAGPPTEGVFAGVSAGKSFSVGYTESGELYCWGVNKHGQLGLGHNNSPIFQPTRVPNFGPTSEFGKVVYASAGATYVAVVAERKQ